MGTPHCCWDSEPPHFESGFAMEPGGSMSTVGFICHADEVRVNVVRGCRWGMKLTSCRAIFVLSAAVVLDRF